MGGEESDLERRAGRPFARLSSRRRGCSPTGGLDPEEGFGGRRATEALVRTEVEVVVERGFEALLEVCEREGRRELESSELLERPPEPLEPCGGEDPVGGAVAMSDRESVRGLEKDTASELTTLSVMR